MKVKIGMNMLLWGVEITPQHIPVFEQLAEAGYDGVEIPVTGQAEADLKRMAHACDELGLARTASAFVPIATQYRPKTVRDNRNWPLITAATAMMKAGESKMPAIGSPTTSTADPRYLVSELVTTLVAPRAISSMPRVTMNEGILANTETDPLNKPHAAPVRTQNGIAAHNE